MKTLISGTKKVLHDIIDINTSEPVTYHIVSNWLDGTAMDDGKVDGILYRKLGTEFYKRVLPNNTIRMESIGVLSQNTPQQNSTAIAAFLNYLPPFFPIKLLCAVATYSFAETIVVSRPISIIGTYDTGYESYKTTFLFPREVNGMRFLSKSYMENVRVYGGDQTQTPNEAVRPGRIGVRGAKGLVVNSYARFKSVTVTHFSGWGLEVFGDIVNGNALDASQGDYYSLEIGVCGEGVRLVGGDANINNFYNLTIRDCLGVGIVDDSFLGNRYFGVHITFCQLGTIEITDPNTCSNFFSVYTEMGQGVSSVTRFTSIIWDLSGTPINGGWQMSGSTCKTEMYFGALKVVQNGFEILGAYGGNTTLLNPNNGYAHLRGRHSNINATDGFFEIGGNGASFGDFQNRRIISSPAVGIQQFYLNSQLFTYANNKPVVGNWWKGDKLFNRNYTGKEVEGWQCIQDGSYGDPPPATVDFMDYAGYIRLHINEYIELPLGITLFIGGAFARIVSREAQRIYILSKTNAGEAPGTPLVLSPPVFKAFGTAVGTTAERPMLDADDKGFQYLDENLGYGIFWSGAAWKKISDGTII